MKALLLLAIVIAVSGSAAGLNAWRSSPSDHPASSRQESGPNQASDALIGTRATATNLTASVAERSDARVITRIQGDLTLDVSLGEVDPPPPPDSPEAASLLKGIAAQQMLIPGGQASALVVTPLNLYGLAPGYEPTGERVGNLPSGFTLSVQYEDGSRRRFELVEKRQIDDFEFLADEPRLLALATDGFDLTLVTQYPVLEIDPGHHGIYIWRFAELPPVPRIVIPAIDVDADIVPGDLYEGTGAVGRSASSYEVATYPGRGLTRGGILWGPLYWAGTEPRPGVFADLSTLKPGDVIQIVFPGEQAREFVVAEIAAGPPEWRWDEEFLTSVDASDTLTLMTQAGSIDAAGHYEGTTMVAAVLR